MSCPHTTSLGAYLLGALDPGERAGFERHLETCPICHGELVRLSPLPGLLAQLTLADLGEPEFPRQAVGDGAGRAAPTVALVPPPAADPAPAEPTPADVEPVVVPLRPRRRWVIAAAAALVLLLSVGGVLGFTLWHPTPAGVTWSAANPANGVSGSAQLVGQPWGTELHLTLAHLPANERCMVVLHTVDGRTEIGGWWTTTGAENTPVPGSSSFALDRIDHLDIVTADQKVLVTLSRPG